MEKYAKKIDQMYEHETQSSMWWEEAAEADWQKDTEKSQHSCEETCEKRNFIGNIEIYNTSLKMYRNSRLRPAVWPLNHDPIRAADDPS